eukprot:scaffold1228_cov119-Cylindrotheca_fusiformis.AAC.4
MEVMNKNEFFVYTSKTKNADIPARETLTRLRVASSVTEIPEQMFTDCNALVQLQLPETLTRIGKYAFSMCARLKCVQFFSPNGSSLDNVSSAPDLEDGLIVFPEEAKLQIDKSAFFFCDGLRKVVICSVSTRLGDGVFHCCKGLVSVELPEGLRVIESNLFAGCKSLATVKMPSSVLRICKDAFFSCQSLTSLDLPHGLLEIGVSSFQHCHSIKSFHVPTTVAAVGKRAFAHCRGLRFIDLPPTLERIEESTFSGCDGLEYINIPPAASYIGWGVFHGCCSLSHIRIPARVDCMIDWAFEGCSNLVSMELPESLLIVNKQAERFYGLSFSCSSLVNLAIPTLTETSVGGYLRETRLGSVVYNNAELVRKLAHRFENSPLNKLCYYQSYYSSDDTMLRLRSLMEDDPLTATGQRDELGMTPLHVLSLSQTPNVDMLLDVMKGGQLDHIIHCKDSFRGTPMDYLCLNRMPDTTNVIRTVLKSRFSYLVALDESFGSDMMKAVEDALSADWSSRRREIGRAYFELANHERKEILTLMELCLWKIRIDEVRSMENTADRKSCRINSGASIVIPPVLQFLGRLDLECYSSLFHLRLLYAFEDY